MFMNSAPATLEGLSPAQRHVLVALKRRGEASVGSLAEALGITPSGIRQHLAALKSAGLVASRQARGRPGRPADLYHSTDLAEAHFSPASGDFTLELLEYIQQEDPNLVPRIFDRRRRRRVDQAHTQLTGDSVEEKVAGLVELLDNEGYLAAFEKLPDHTYRMTLHNCAIWGVASQYGQACTTELEFLREVLSEADIERVSHKVAGAYVCGYHIRPRAENPQTSPDVPVLLVHRLDDRQNVEADTTAPTDQLHAPCHDGR
jgi:predicted ArsR family transcriptional regulator